MSGNKNRLSDKQIGRLYDMIEKRSFYAVVSELHRVAGLASGDNIPESVHNWMDVHAALGCAVDLMDNQASVIRIQKEPEHEPAPKPRGARKVRLRNGWRES